MLRFEGSKIIHDAPIKRCACRDYFYGEDERIELELSRMEKEWSKLLKILLGKWDSPGNQIEWLERQDPPQLIFSLFSVSETRTALQGDDIASLSDFLKKQYPTAFNSWEVTPEGEVVDSHPVLYGLDRALVFAEDYAGLDFVVIRNNSMLPFITSDNPVLTVNPLYRQQGLRGGIGLMSAGVQKYLPISPDTCICLYDRYAYSIKNVHEGMYFLGSVLEAARINKAIVENAYEQIYYNNSVHPLYIRWICRNRKGPASRLIIGKAMSKDGELTYLSKKEIKSLPRLGFYDISQEALQAISLKPGCGLSREELFLYSREHG